MNGNPLPNGATVLAEQLAFVGRGRRREIVLVLLCAVAMLMLAVFPARLPTLLALELANDDSTVELRWLDPKVLELFAEPRLIVHVFAYEVLLFVGLLWPLSVWRGESPRRRDAFWTMPVTRPLHETLRIVAGAIWLLVLCAVMVALSSLGIALGGHADALGSLSRLAWVSFFSGPLTLYLLASVAALRSEHPGRALCGAFAALFVPFAFFGAIDFEPGYRFFLELVGGELSYSAALAAPIEDVLEKAIDQRRPAGPAICLWLGLALGGVVAAVRRAHDT